jgi:hypothetical protein
MIGIIKIPTTASAVPRRAGSRRGVFEDRMACSHGGVVGSEARGLRGSIANGAAPLVAIHFRS